MWRFSHVEVWHWQVLVNVHPHPLNYGYAGLHQTLDWEQGRDTSLPAVMKGKNMDKNQRHGDPQPPPDRHKHTP